MFYALPEHAHFYSELVNMAESPGDAAGDDAGDDDAPGGVTALFCKYDALALGRVAGAGRARKMAAAEGGTFLFVSQ